MRAVDSSIALASELNKQLIVFWGRDRFVNCKFSDLFQQPKHFKVLEENQHYGKKALFPYLPGSRPSSLLRQSFYSFTKLALGIRSEILFEDLEDALLPLGDVAPPRITGMKDFEQKSYQHITPLLTRLKDEGSAFVCSAWRLHPEQNYKQNLVPVDRLNRKVTALTQGFGQTIGIHIRRTDHSQALQYSNLDKFKEAIDQELRQDKNATFFLATDCPRTESELKRKYKNRIITFEKTSYNRNSTQGIQDALVDLCCLSRTNKILGSYFSSFSQVASEITGIREETVY
ncbi:hypothetical protein [Pontibacter ummariensis]|nr:hypothetical protein [Pontibacter ummariensis]